MRSSPKQLFHKTAVAAFVSIAIPAVLILGTADFSIADPARPMPTGHGLSPQGAAQEQAPTQASIPVAPAPLPVSVVHLKTESWPDSIPASGYIMPWQESRIGTEVGGLRLLSILVSVGDSVKKGQVLARLNAATVETDLAAANAQLVEAEATLAQAVATVERAKRLEPTGGVSQQELTLYETQRRTGEARVNAARAQVKRQQLRLEYATLVAPDDGVISSSSAAEGAIVQAGSELFSLIRQGRLEWRAEVKGERLLRLLPGQEVTLKSPLGQEVKGRVRRVSPTIDVTTGNGLVYVDLPGETNLKAGLNISGFISVGKRKALVLPTSAVMEKEGNSKVLIVNGDNKTEAVEVKTGRTKDEWVEIIAGVDEHAKIVSKGQGILTIGDAVKIVAKAD